MKRALKDVLTILYAFTVILGANGAVIDNQRTIEFYPPIWGGGYQLIDAHNGYGEPLNVSASKLLRLLY